MNKKKISLIIMLVLLFIGFSVLLYPSISTYWNSKTQSTVISNYEQFIQSFSQEDYDKFYADAVKYNSDLSELEFPLKEYPKIDGYNEAINLDGTGVMGYITISSIGIELPIYHGTSEDVLVFAAGHMKGTSLPVGGASTHSVLSAHRGLPNAKLFTDLDKLQKGDVFTITVLNRVLTYEIDSILTVKPENISDIMIEKGEDHCTLVTCTPYGVNTHRLLVRGTRVDTLSKKKTYIGAEAYRIDEMIVTPIVALPMLFIFILFVVFQPVKTEYFNEGDVFDGKKKESS